MTGERIATRGNGTLRVGGGIPNVPPIGMTRVDAGIYTDPAQWERERDTIFRATWIIADRSERIREPGQFLVWEEFGETVVVTRQADGSVAAWHNVCQHRGARIVDPARVLLAEKRGGDVTPLSVVNAAPEEIERRDTGPVVGTCRSGDFVCPWHGFRYAPDGTVTAVPERIDFEPAALAGLRAPKVAVEDWAGWIWINLAGDAAEPLLDYLGPEIIEELGHHDMANMICLDKREYVMPTNWKAVVDGFIEVYHVAETHRETIGERLGTRNTIQHLLDRHSMYFIPRASSLEQYFAERDHIRNGISHYLVFPNSIFNCNATHIQAFQPVPIDATTAKYNVYLLVQPGGDESFMEHMDTSWAHFQDVAKEDLYAATQLGATVRSMGYTRNLMNAREVRIPHFLDVVRSYTDPDAPPIIGS